MGTLADEMHPSLAMDLARIQYVLAAPIEALRKTGVHPSLDPAHIVVGEGVLEDDLSTATPYAAPETIRNGELDERSNVYSLGVILRALLGDREGQPFAATALVQECVNEDPMRRLSLPVLQRKLAAFSWRPSMIRDADLQAQRPFIATDARERALADALRANPADLATRAVYADWLEENGFEARARFLRVELSGREAEAIESELRKLALPDETSWRATISGSARVWCWTRECPKRWSDLKPTKHDNIRVCPNCSRAVYYITTVVQASLHKHRGEQLAIDPMLTDEEVRGAPRDIPMPAMNPPAPRTPVSIPLGPDDWRRKK